MSASRRRHEREGEHGQIVVTFAIALSLFLMGLIAMVADLSTMFGASALVNQAAQAGAYAGATDVNYAVFRATGVVQLNALPGPCTTAISAINAAMGTTPHVVACTINAVNRAQMDVTVTSAVPLPVSFGVPTQTVSATYHAYAQPGTTTPT